MGVDDERGAVPLDLELWQHVREAVVDARRAADSYLASNGWVPRVSMPEVRSFDSGWPDLTRGGWPAVDSGPIHLSRLFGAARTSQTPVTYGDVPGLSRLLDHVLARPDLVEQIRPILLFRADLGNEREAAAMRMVHVDIADLALSVMDRAVAVGADNDTALLDIYRQRERSWLADELPAQLLVPLALTQLELEEPLPLSETVRLERLDQATQAARVPSPGGLSTVPSPVIGAATHAIVIDGVRIPNRPRGKRIWSSDVGPLPLDQVDLVCQAMRVVTHLPVGYAQVLLRPIGWADHWIHDLPALKETATLHRYPDGFDNYGWLKVPKPVDATALARLPTVFKSLQVASPKIQLAARRLSLAELRQEKDDKTVDACIGLEALLGEGQDELSHRLGLRAATALATRMSEPDAQAVYGFVKTIYSHRSAVVHGTTSSKHEQIWIGNELWETSMVACLLLRQLLLDKLERSPAWTPASLDAALLASLNGALAGTRSLAPEE